jgi:hypothetical protein
MKLSHLILGSLIALLSFVANHAQAKNNDDLPPSIIVPVKDAKVIAISELWPGDRAKVDEILERSHLYSLERPVNNVFAVVRDGRVEFNRRSDIKTLSDSMLLTLAQLRICDSNVFGECVIYDRNRDDDLHVFVIGSRMYEDGTVEFVQSTYDTRLTRATDGFLYGLAVHMKKYVKSKRVIFTRATRRL